MKKINQILRKISKVNYPSQYEVEFLVEWTTAVNYLSSGTISGSPIKQAFEKADQERMDVGDYAFGNSSPWSVKNMRNKPKVYWNNEKAKRLGLQ